MRMRTVIVSSTLAALLAPSPALAQQHIADAAALQHATDARSATDASNRALINRVLGAPDVEQRAADLGLSITRAQSAVATLSSEDLARLAAAARTVERDRVAGASNQTVTISITTLLLILILVVLIAD